MSVICPGPTMFPGSLLFPDETLSAGAMLDPFSLAGSVSGPNMHDYTGTGYGGLVT